MNGAQMVERYRKGEKAVARESSLRSGHRTEVLRMKPSVVTSSRQSRYRGPTTAKERMERVG